MKKIPTLFKRDPDDMRRVLPEVTPGCEWVLAGEGIATRKYDGTCVMFDGERWWARREVKPGKDAPAGWVQVDHDETTGKRVGWEPAEQGSFWKAHLEALDGGPWAVGTYELVGPKVQGNLEEWKAHVLIRHEDASPLGVIPLTFDGLRDLLTNEDDWPRRWEGIVWHHPDGRMAKLKRRDFPARAGRTGTNEGNAQ